MRNCKRKQIKEYKENIATRNVSRAYLHENKGIIQRRKNEIKKYTTEENKTVLRGTKKEKKAGREEGGN